MHYTDRDPAYLDGETVRRDEETALRDFVDGLGPGALRTALLDVLDALRDHAAVAVRRVSDDDEDYYDTEEDPAA